MQYSYCRPVAAEILQSYCSRDIRDLLCKERRRTSTASSIQEEAEEEGEAAEEAEEAVDLLPDVTRRWQKLDILKI